MKKEAYIFLAFLAWTFAIMFFGYVSGKGTIIKLCTQKNFHVFENRIILECKVHDIDAVLESKYWERK